MDRGRDHGSGEPAPLAEPALQLPWDFARTPTTGMAPDRFPFRLAASSVEDAMIVAAFAISLHRYSGQPAIPLHVTRAGQTRALELPLANATCPELMSPI